MTTISRKKFSNSKLYQRFTIVQIVTPEISLKNYFLLLRVICVEKGHSSRSLATC